MGTKIENMVSVGIIYRTFDPAHILLEISTNKLMLIGGKPTKNDSCPLETFRREINEDLSITCNDDTACKKFQHIKSAILNSARPFGDFKNHIAGAIHLISCWVSGLTDQEWYTLCKLQKYIGNLSRKATTAVVSPQDLAKTKAKMIFGHDRVLQNFWLLNGIEEAELPPLTPDTKSVRIGHPLSSYKDYRLMFDG